jgi:hypothetical protein
VEQLAQAIEELRVKAAPLFPGMNIREQTGGRWNWATVLNKRYRNEIPPGCFAYSGRFVMVVRDPFFDWWLGSISQQRPNLPGAFRPRRSNRKES